MLSLLIEKQSLIFWGMANSVGDYFFGLFIYFFEDPETPLKANQLRSYHIAQQGIQVLL